MTVKLSRVPLKSDYTVDITASMCYYTLLPMRGGQMMSNELINKILEDIGLEKISHTEELDIE